VAQQTQKDDLQICPTAEDAVEEEAKMHPGEDLSKVSEESFLEEGNQDGDSDDNDQIEDEDAEI